MKKLFPILLFAIAAFTMTAQTTYIVWQHTPATDNEQWINSNYYIWEKTYTQTNVDDALEFTSAGKGWIGGGYESALPFNNLVLTEGYDLVFDIRTTDKKELSVQLTCAAPKAAQSVKLSFDRNGQWQTIRLNLKKDFPKVYEAWSRGTSATDAAAGQTSATGASAAGQTNGYVFSIVGGASDNARLYLRNIRYEPTR